MNKFLKKAVIIPVIIVLVLFALIGIAYIRVQIRMEYEPASFADFVWQAWNRDSQVTVLNSNVAEATLGDYVIRTMDVNGLFGHSLITTLGVNSTLGEYFIFMPQDFEGLYIKNTSVNPYDKDDETEYVAIMSVFDVDDKIVIEINSDHLFNDNFGEPELIIENDGNYCYDGRYYQYFILDKVPDDYCIKSWIIEFTGDDVLERLNG